MNILVTGGAGFIGSHLVDHLVQQRRRVVVLDNFSTGRKQFVHPRASLVRGSITSSQLVSKTLQRYHIGTIVHLAAQKNARYSVEQPLFDADQNIIGSLTLLEAARQQHVKRFVFASTGGIMYGRAKQVPTPETSPAQPQVPYAIAKRTVEQYLEFYQTVYGLSTIALRLSNVYGPRQDPAGEAGVVAIFLSQLLTGKIPAIYGSGKQTRDYVFVADVVTALSQAIDKPARGIYNIGTGKQTSVRQLYQQLNVLVPKPRSPRLAAAVPGDLAVSALQAATARRRLAWQSSTTLSAGLQITYRWFEQYYGSSARYL
ncbi:MAG: NAD-dependent epimerase/dehydratase family protein [Candidatus Kerfeldbacteria bacterium]|nr:NAD-dependent epimerase/dehydratase family protein [Candidatus Kerfeldbacteria bacterium]